MADPFGDINAMIEAALGATLAGGTSAAGAGASYAGINYEDPVIWVGTSEWSDSTVKIDQPRKGTEYPWQHRGPGPWIPTPSPTEHATRLETRDQFAASEAMLQLQRWYGQEEYDRWADLVADLGLVEEEDKTSFTSLEKWWQQAVALTANFARVGKTITPWTAIRMIAGDQAAVDARTGRGETGGPRTTRHEQINLTSPQDAKALINNVLAQHLGRRPTGEELSAFTATLNAAEKASPSVTVTNYDEDGNSASSTTSGGIGAAGAATIVEDEARALPEYAEFQAATTYFNALIAALDSPV